MDEIRVDRAVEVLLHRGIGARPQWRVGSGSLVLTAAHNVGEGRLTVRGVDGVELDAVLLPDRPAPDMAVLDLGVPPPGRDLTPIRCAAVGRDFAGVLEHCWAIGFPWFKETPRGRGESPLRDSEHVRGSIAVGANLVSRRLELMVTAVPAHLPAPGRSPWQGMSGALVFAEHAALGTLGVGVIIEHHLPEGGSSLTVEPFLAGAGEPLPWSGPGRPDAVLTLGSRAEVDLQHDAELLRHHLVVFQRPAFSVPCAEEFFLSELREAIDNSLAALNTGSLFSRRDAGGGANLLRSFGDISRYRRPDFRSRFRGIVRNLMDLKRELLGFESYFRTVNPGYSHHENFYAMFYGFAYAPGGGSRPTAAVLSELINRMEAIDQWRNEIRETLNGLLAVTGDEPLDLIDPTSRTLAERWRQQVLADGAAEVQPDR